MVSLCLCICAGFVTICGDVVFVGDSGTLLSIKILLKLSRNFVMFLLSKDT